ncbi:MAG TPA: outer membrane protein assembly factor BamA [Vicinamibacterales bacterium]|nr:outer membrane protein assembly factor BamA [Vicinamibacterales bacterium]
MGTSRAAVLLLIVALATSTACKDDGTIVVRRLTVQGVKGIDEGRLRSALAIRQSSRLPWGKKRPFDRARFDDDLKRIQAFYTDRGYPDAKVTNFDVKLDDTRKVVDLTVTIDEGQPVKVVAIDFAGFDVIPAAHLDELKKTAPLKIGQPRDRQLVASTHEMAVNELKDHGYPYGKVSTDENDGPDGKQATITLTAQPGDIAYFGEIEVAGNKSVGDNVIRRELTFKPGDLYQRNLVQESQRRLYGLELFQFVNIESLNPDLQPSEVPMRVTVAEGKHQRVNLGVGYGTEEKARVDAEYHEVNFLGDARSAGAHVRWSSLDRGIRLDFNQPYFLHPYYSMGAQAQQWYTYTPAYNSVVSGGKVTFTHRVNVRRSWSVSVTSERDKSSIAPDVLNDPTLRNALIALGLDPTTLEQSGTLNSFGFDMQQSTADNLLNAHHGYQIAAHVEQAGRIIPGTFKYDAATVDARHYLPISDQVVVATRLQLGSIHALGNDPANIPFSKKYFLGGATSIRGWGRYEVGPLSSGLPIGGNSMFAFSAEARAMLHGNLGGVLFFDTGNVWSNAWGFNANDLRYAIGPGLRYQTPIGPLRFDFGYQLNPEPELLVNGSPQTRRWRVHFSIGQAF